MLLKLTLLTIFIFLLSYSLLWCECGSSYIHPLKKQTRDTWFEENSQDLFLLREFQNIREGPDTCICQEKVSKFNRFKKTRVFRKADMTAWMEQELFYTQGRLRDRSEAIAVPGMFHMFIFLFLMWTTHFNTLLKHDFNGKKKRETEAKGTHCTFRGLKEKPTLTWLNR